jgi:hypothetical protein
VDIQRRQTHNHVPNEVELMTVHVTLSYDPFWEPLVWAKEHCSSYITNEAGPAKMKSVPGGWVNANRDIVYYFGNEKDAMWFTLRWSS